MPPRRRRRERREEVEGCGAVPLLARAAHHARAAAVLAPPRPDRHARGLQALDQAREPALLLLLRSLFFLFSFFCGGEAGVDQERLDGVAGGGVVQLRVEDDGERALDGEALVDEDVADAVGVAQHRDAGAGLHVRDERVAAARDDEVDDVVEL